MNQMKNVEKHDVNRTGNIGHVDVKNLLNFVVRKLKQNQKVTIKQEIRMNQMTKSCIIFVLTCIDYHQCREGILAQD